MCNCRSCKPSLYRSHANSLSFNHQYQSQAFSASIIPPPIPPQPNFRFNETIIPYEVPPPPPPRLYQLIPIRNESQAALNQVQTVTPRNSIEQPQKNLSSFNRSYNRRNDYENLRDFSRSPVVKDPRRKPYYYNELNQNSSENDGLPVIDVNGSVDNLSNDLQKIQSKKIEELDKSEDNRLDQNKLFNSNSTMAFGSGGSLENII